MSNLLQDNHSQYDEKDAIWEMYHENSKLGRYDYIGSEDHIVSKFLKLYESLSYEGFDFISLPNSFSKLEMDLDEAILKRVTSRQMRPAAISLIDVRTILHYAYGISRTKDGIYSRSFRTTPSGGALYPLELYFSSKYVESLAPGIYHYDPIKNGLNYIIHRDTSAEISNSMAPPQGNLAFDVSMIIFITAIFERQIFKYGPRGYRFAFLEAGHVAQNINLVSTALGLGSINIAGYFDREIDDLLGIDGINHSTIYMIGLGQKNDDNPVETSQSSGGQSRSIP